MKRVAIIGSGPAALMAADVVASAGIPVTVFEKRKSAGRKLLVAGSSGLNITNSLPLPEFAGHYQGGSPEFWDRAFRAFSPQDWTSFIERLGIKTFEGTSGRYFIEDMKASKFLQAWIQRLGGLGVEFRYGQELTDFESGGVLEFSGTREKFDAVCFCLGGGSWEPTEVPLRWPEIFKRHHLAFREFTASNVGYQVAWSEAFLKEAEGKPLKRIVLHSARGSRMGDAMVTSYGMEGTPVYFVGTRGEVRVDLKPDLTAEQILSKLRGVKENLSPIRRVKKQLGLCEASFALVYHYTPREILSDPGLTRLASHLKGLPLQFGEPQ
ncbi:MAG: NAD(P)/FAD-dependent oxidoreductase, partial [Bdellovibrionota bacterium]